MEGGTEGGCGGEGLQRETLDVHPQKFNGLKV
jgi:hypothetical protein